MANNYKSFKDPVYGYIHIPRNIVDIIIDSAEFQRLRYIRQTSYVPLYSAALHNRFIHSLGVYYLGEKAFNAIKNNAEHQKKKLPIDWPMIYKTFTLACLLHDIGHAPFSHSGEDFFLQTNINIKDEPIYTFLKDFVDSEEFTRDMDNYSQKKKSAAPHEIMSAVVALKRFPQYFKDKNMRELFARCITGYKYTQANSADKSIYNVFISLLNSSTIDVDRLDYLIRDAFVIGYDSITIDYDRLLNGVILREENDIYYLAYQKMSLSVIENVIYSHDSEKKWIQSHPVILYEHFLVQRIISEIRDNFLRKHSDINIFSLDSLLEGTSEQEVSLLCDDDIIHWAKGLKSPFAKEFFNRSLRRHPIWKSEAEYKVILDGLIGEDVFPKLQSQLVLLEKFLLTESSTKCIDITSKSECENLLKATKADRDLSEKDKKGLVSRYKIVLTWLKCFENIHKKQKILFDFVLLKFDNFKSGFDKDELANTKIYFSSFNKDYSLGKLIPLLSGNKEKLAKPKIENIGNETIERDTFFYVYYKKGIKEIDEIEVGKEIAKAII